MTRYALVGMIAVISASGKGGNRTQYPHRFVEFLRRWFTSSELERRQDAMLNRRGTLAREDLFSLFEPVV